MLSGVQVGGAQGERATTAAGGLDVEAQDERIEGRVVAGGGSDLVDLSDAGVRDGVPRAWSSAAGRCDEDDQTVRHSCVQLARRRPAKGPYHQEVGNPPATINTHNRVHGRASPVTDERGHRRSPQARFRRGSRSDTTCGNEVRN